MDVRLQPKDIQPKQQDVLQSFQVVLHHLPDASPKPANYCKAFTGAVFRFSAFRTRSNPPTHPQAIGRRSTMPKNYYLPNDDAGRAAPFEHLAARAGPG